MLTSEMLFSQQNVSLVLFLTHRILIQPYSFSIPPQLEQAGITLSFL
jgi:hypothetical protein